MKIHLKSICLFLNREYNLYLRLYPSTDTWITDNVHLYLHDLLL